MMYIDCDWYKNQQQDHQLIEHQTIVMILSLVYAIFDQIKIGKKYDIHFPLILDNESIIRITGW